MQFANTPYRRASRTPTGLVITVAVHAAVLVLGLIGFGVVETPAPPRGPLIASNIPDTPAPARRDALPPIRDLPVPTNVDRPIIEIVDAPRVDTTTTTVFDAAASDIATGTTADAKPVVADPPSDPVGATRRASIDQRFLRDFEAPYPPASQRLGETGTVVVRVSIGVDGRVLRATIAQSSGFARLDDAAVRRALAKWRFVPALENGVAVEGEREVPVIFRLRD